MTRSFAFVFARYVAMLFLTAVVWLIAGMVYFERFFPPFDRILPVLMPWKGLGKIPPTSTLGERLSIMQGLVDSSNRVAGYSLAVLAGSFALFSVYLTLVYQQRQRKTHENRLLLLKNREIARRNEFIRYISATIGHEFKNNLGRIKRRIDLLSGLPDDAKKRIDGTFEKLFADIDIFKKISDEREAGLVDFTMVDLNAMLSALAQQFGDLAEVSFRKEPQMRPPVIYASQTLLRTVFENLVDNAIKYKKPQQQRARIGIVCAVDFDGIRRYVSLSFRDEGEGMDDLQADLCFYKGKGSAGGWGEGLYFAKYVVGLHAGKIRVGKEYTKPGGGTEIIINLPYVEESLYV